MDAMTPSIVTIAEDIVKNTVNVFATNVAKQARKTASVAMFVKNTPVSAAKTPVATDPVTVMETVGTAMSIANVFVMNVVK